MATKHTTAPPEPDMSATIDRLRQVAAESGNRLLLGEGPPHPDRELLDICAEAMHWRRLYDEGIAAWRAKAREDRNNAEIEEAFGYQTTMRNLLFRAKKLRAVTAAGIYAKALIVRSSQRGAPVLAMSLADDLIACPGLRQSLWPAEVQL